MRRQAIFLVERGWHGMREFSIFLAKRDFLINVIIKGYVPPNILNIITGYSEISIVSIRRKLFRLFVYWKVLREKLLGNLRCIVVSKNRTKRWVSRIGWALNYRTITLIEEDGSYKLIDENGKEERKEDIIRLLQM